MKRKVLAILLSALLILTLLPGTVLAAAPAISKVALDPSNVRVIIDFSEGVYGNIEHNAPVKENDFTLTFQQNGGAVTNMSITSARTLGNTDPVGGETSLLIYFTFTGGPASGLETFAIGPADGSSIYNASGEAMTATETTGTITLNDLTPAVAVCQIGATPYTTLDTALGAVPADGATATTIRLLQNINYTGGITVANKKITFDLNGKTLSVDNTAGTGLTGLTVTNGSEIDITNPGAFNVKGSATGLSASNSTVKVTNVNSSTLHGINASNNSDITVTNDVTSASYMAVAASGGSNISIGGNVTGANYGVYAQDAGTTITVTGNASATGDNGYGAHSRGGAAITVYGNITATGSNSIGANLNTGGTLTVDGIITAQSYIMFGTVEKTAADITTPTSKPGYNTYTDDTSTVWVKAYVAEIEGTEYATLDLALDAVQEQQTITLLTNITDTDGLVISNEVPHFTINLGSYNLTVSNTTGTGIGLKVTKSNVTLAGTGSFDVSGSEYGVYVDKAHVTVTNAASSSTAAVYATTGEVTVKGNVTATDSCIGAWATTGSQITVNGGISVEDAGNYVQLWSTTYPCSAGVYPIPSTGYVIYKKDAVNTILVDSIWTSGYPTTFNVLDEDFILQVSADKACTVYYVVLPSDDPVPSAEQVQKQQDANDVDVTLGGSFSYNTPANIRNHYVDNLEPETSYIVYVVAKDSAGVLQPPVLVDVTTIANIDNVPDAGSGIIGSVPGAAGSKRVTLTVKLLNAAGQPIDIYGPGYFTVSVDGSPVVKFDDSPFSGFVNNLDGTYTVFFTGAADGTPYELSNLRVHSEDLGVTHDVIIQGSYTVTTPPAVVIAPPPPPASGVAGDTSYQAEVTAGTQTESLQVIVNDTTDTAAVTLTGAQAEVFFGGGSNVNVTMPHISGVSMFTLGIPAEYLSKPDRTPTLTLETEIGSFVLPSDMLFNNPEAAGKVAEISIGQGDTSGLPDSVKAAIGSHPVIQLTLKLDGQQTEWNNPGAPVTVTIPYEPTPEELLSPESIVIWYIDGSGNAVMIPNGHYDPATGCVTFDTTHFSRFAAGYSRVNFGDVPSGAWFGKAVGFIAARGITTGTGGGNFSPDEKLTRGDFIVMLMKAYGISPDSNPMDNFSDAGNTYYTGYLAAAKRLGIAGGIGGNLFAPEKEITRQEMFALIYNALKIIDKLPEGKAGPSLSDFSDQSQIATWAKDAMTVLVETGAISGTSGRLYPTGTTTRAEMAQVLYNLLSR